MKFTAVGDVIIGRRIQEDYVGFSELAPIINQGDAKFFNLETTLNHEGECYASQVSGGTWLRTDPEVLEDVQNFGFNMTSFNNNHAMDFAFDGLLCTLDAVNQSGLVHAGVGRNLAEAAAPRYLETEAGRVALIGVNASLSGQMVAGEQTERMPGRPGVNPLRVSDTVELEAADFEALKRIIQKSGINAGRDIAKREGYYGGMNDAVQYIRDVNFVLGEETRGVPKMNEKDLHRIEKAIYEAQLQADYIMISLHSHAIVGTEKEQVAPYLTEFAHFCIDHGAHAVVGHGPHLLRPIEVYKECPIFYSLGDFVLQLYNIAFAPEEFYAEYGLSSKDTVHELLKKRSKDFTIGLMEDHRMLETVIPYWETEGGKLKELRLYPVTLTRGGKRSEEGLPRLASGSAFLDDFIARCAKYGTKIERAEDGSLVCRW
ncbi:MAG: CapA family protein [Clostridia bacterium]|nr:CapA family protein [Clostridia bacterium]